MSNKIIKKYMFVLITLVITVFTIEWICNLKVITLPNEKKGIHEIEQSNIKVQGLKKEGGQYYLTEPEGTLTLQWDGSYIDKLKYDFQSTECVNATITVGMINSFEKEEEINIEDNNPLLLSESIVNIKEKVNWITIVLHKSQSDQNISIRNIAIDNSVAINGYRMFSVVLIVLGIALIFGQRKMILKKIEYGFCVIALVSGVIMLIALPTNKVGWDEETHFRWAYEISLWPGGEMVSSQNAGLMDVTVYNWPYNQPNSYEEKKNLEKELDWTYKEGDHAVHVNGCLNKGKICGLIFHAAGIKIARMLGMSFHNIFLAGRMAGLIMYVIVMTLAIHLIPIGKRILTFIGLMPTSIFLAVCYTYDTAIMAFISLGVAIILREWLDKEKKQVNIRNLIIADIYLFWGIWCKAIYAPLVLIGYFIPKEKFKNKKQMWLYRSVSIIIFVILMATFILPQLLNPNDRSDPRISGADSGSQMDIIFSHIVTYGIVLIRSIWKTLGDYVIGNGTYGVMGHLNASGFLYLIPILAIVVIVTEKSEENIEVLTAKQRIGVFLLISISVAMIWTALYISYNNVGATSIGGVQGRYYHPLLPLLYIIFTGGYLKVKIKETMINMSVLIVCAIIICTTSLKIIGTFCM